MFKGILFTLQYFSPSCQLHTFNEVKALANSLVTCQWEEYIFLRGTCIS